METIISAEMVTEVRRGFGATPQIHAGDGSIVIHTPKMTTSHQNNHSKFLAVTNPNFLQAEKKTIEDARQKLSLVSPAKIGLKILLITKMVEPKMPSREERRVSAITITAVILMERKTCGATQLIQKRGGSTVNLPQKRSSGPLKLLNHQKNHSMFLAVIKMRKLQATKKTIEDARE